MNQNIGFRRNIFLAWLDATAALSVETADLVVLRARLDPIVGATISSKENRRMAIDILLTIWVKSEDDYPYLLHTARRLFAQSERPGDRVWLHYGLTCLAYDFFRFTVATIGQISRYEDGVTPKKIKQRVFASLGQMGGMDKATERVLFSLRDWGILMREGAMYHPLRQALTTTQRAVEVWLLEAILTAHPAQELPFTDLVRLPELFPFRFTLGVDDLRQAPRFEVHRQGLGWDMVRAVPHITADPGIGQPHQGLFDMRELS